jgi:hypothetical protein
MRHIFIICLVLIARLSPGQSISIDSKTGKSGTHYTFIYKNTCKIAFTNVRPDKSQSSTLACIPAAFTNLDNNNKIDGIYAVNGVIGNTTAVNTTLGGVWYIEKNTCKVFQSGKGKLLKTDSLQALVKTNKASFFQQIQCIQNGKASGFEDKKIFQRRGIAIMKDRSIAIIESKEAITLKVFSDDLVLLGVTDLIYTDMGSWDEGWYRDPVSGKLVVIGTDLSQTARQSNWVIFQK